MNYNWTSAISFLLNIQMSTLMGRENKRKQDEKRKCVVYFLRCKTSDCLPKHHSPSPSRSRSFSLSFFSSLLYVRPQNDTANEKTFPSKLSSRNRENDFTVHKRNLIYSPQGWNEGTRVTLNDYQYIKKKRVNTFHEHNNCCAPN